MRLPVVVVGEQAPSLRASAGAGLIWGVMFTLGRDVIQFLSMLILVRILSPEVYGQFALAQAILLFLSVISMKSLATFALQARDPANFDWDAHYSAGLVVNAFVFAATLLVAGGLYAFGGASLQTVAMVVAVLSLTFPAEIIGTYYFTWLQAQHQWQRMRMLLLVGAIFSSIGAILLAMAGAGVFSLAFGGTLLIVPLLIDYFVRQPVKPRFRRDWYHRYREGIRFGLNRSAAGAVTSGSVLVEQGVISGVLGFATLGLYTRAVGLASITSGRIGPVVMQTLYPVLTRAEANSEQFRRFARILYQGVLWTSFPAAAFLALEGERIVGLLYGGKWVGVVPLMGGAALLLAVRGLYYTLNLVMLANSQHAACLRLEAITSLSSLFLVPVAMFFGPKIYLYALSAHGAAIVGITAYLAARGGAIAWGDAIRLGTSCLVAIAVGAVVHTVAAEALSLVFNEWSVIAILAVTGSLFGLAYVATLRVIAPNAFYMLIEALPLPHRLGRRSPS